MANRKISALSALLSGDVSTANDYLPIIDASVVDADKNKRITVNELIVAMGRTGITLTDPVGARTSLIAHDTQGPYWQLGNNGDEWTWRNLSGTNRMTLNSSGTLTVGGGSARPLVLKSSGATGNNYVDFVQNDGTIKGFVGYGNAGDDTFFFENLVNNASNRYAVNGSGAHNFYTGGGTATQLKVAHTASAVNFLQLSGSPAGGRPYLIANGTDSNVGIDFGSRGTGAFTFYTRYNISAKPQFQIADAADSVNYIYVSGGATGNAALIAATGSDTNVAMALSTTGTGAFDVFTNSFSTRQFRVAHVASAVNYLQVYGNSTGNAPAIEAAGSDTNINLQLIPKGTGVVQFGTHTGSGDVAISGYITIKDAAGNTRKLAVIT